MPFYHELNLDWTSTPGPSDGYPFPSFEDETNPFFGADMVGTLTSSGSHVFPDFPTPSSDFGLHMQNLGLTADGMQSPALTDCDNLSVAVHAGKASLAPIHQQRPSQRYTSAGPEIHSQVSTPPCLPSPPLQRSQSRSGPCVSSLTRVIENLECKIQDDSLALDEVMHLNKASLCEIGHIITMEEFKGSASCPLLVSIAMGQIIALFESSIRSEGFGPSSFGALPHLRLGNFQVDPEEQNALRAHIICKELRRSIKVLETMNSTLRNPSTHSIQSANLHKQWSTDMASRLEALIVAVEN